MNETHKRFQETFNKLYTLSIVDKMKFLEILLFDFTITGRAIWSDVEATDSQKVEAFKWLNELVHRIWGTHFELKRNEDNDSITRLYENMKFYGEQSILLRKQLVPTTLGAFKNFEERQ